MLTLRRGLYFGTMLVLFTLLANSMATAATIASLAVTNLDDFDGAGTSLIDGTATLKATLDSSYAGDINPALYFGDVESRVYWDSGLDDTNGTADDKTHVLYIIEHGANSTIPLREFDITDSQVANVLQIGDVIQSGDLDSLDDSADPPTLTGDPLDSIDTFEGAFNSIGFNWEDANGFVLGGDKVAVYLTYQGLLDWSIIDGRTKDTQNISEFFDVLAVTVPEPATMLLMGSGLIAVGRIARKKRNRKEQK